MKRTIVLVLLLGALALAGEKQSVKFRLKKDPEAPVRGWCLDYDDKGFTFQAFGSQKRVFIPWSDLVADDARQYRQKFHLEMTEDERLGLIEGHELHFKGGLSRFGVLDRHDKKAKVYWLRHDGMVLPYPEGRVDRVEEVKVKEAEVYTEEEVYIHRLQRRPPSNAREHRLLADYMFDIGNWNKAREHYLAAIEADATLRDALEPRIASCKDYIEDKEAGAFFRRAKSLANLQGDYDGAISMIEGYAEQHPGAKRRGIRVIDEIRERQHQKLIVVFHRTKNRAFDRVIRGYISRRKPGIQEAMSWVSAELGKSLKAYVRGRMGITDEQFDDFMKERPRYSPHFATYWSGSFVISKRAKKGKSSANAVRGDPDAWWGQYADNKTRSTWIKAYAAERLPDLFEVVWIRHKACDKCGGRGQVKHMSLRGLRALGGKHEWWELCPRCYGAKEDRSVAYR